MQVMQSAQWQILEGTLNQDMATRDRPISLFWNW